MVTTSPSEKSLTCEEEKRLFKIVRQYGDVLARRDRAWMELMITLGIRVGTMAGMTVRDAKLAISRENLNVRREIAKRGLGYTVFVPKRGISCLRVLLMIHREMGGSRNEDDQLLINRRGKGITVRSLQLRAKYWAKMADLPEGFTTHWFRHTRAMRILENSEAKEPLVEVARLLGHTGIASVMHYIRPTSEQLRESMERSQ
ncbi:MAG: site-specific integrase [Magnetococcales bacterium]|nr:site-specific integrase [Magnetococcales bacterium]